MGLHSPHPRAVPASSAAPKPQPPLRETSFCLAFLPQGIYIRDEGEAYHLKTLLLCIMLEDRIWQYRKSKHVSGQVMLNQHRIVFDSLYDLDMIWNLNKRKTTWQYLWRRGSVVTGLHRIDLRFPIGLANHMGNYMEWYLCTGTLWILVSATYKYQREESVPESRDGGFV